MRKQLWLLSIITLCALFLLPADSAFAETGFGFHAGYMKSQIMDSGFYVGGQLRFRLSPAFSIETAIDYRDEKTNGNIEYKGEVTRAETIIRSYPITGSMIFTLFAEKKIPLNLIGGVGVYFYSLTFRPENQSSTSETDVRFGYHLGAGTEYPISLGVRADAGFRYVFLDLQDEYGDIILSDANANAFMIHAGLTFYF